MKVTLDITQEGNIIYVRNGDDIRTNIRGFGKTIPEALQFFAEDWRKRRADEFSKEG